MDRQKLISLIAQLEETMRDTLELYKKMKADDRPDIVSDIATAAALLKTLADAVVRKVREYVRNDEALAEYLEQRLFALGVEALLDEMRIEVAL